MLPADVEALEVGWLNDVLQGRGLLGRARVLGFRQAPHAGGFAVTSRVTRLVLELQPEDRRAIRSLVVKLPNPEFPRTQENCEAEIDFYRTVEALDLSLPVPRCYYSAYDRASGRSILLLEDLSEASPGHPPDEGCTLAQARAALVGLARLQARLWRSPRLERWDLPPHLPLGPRPDRWRIETATRVAQVQAEGRYPCPPSVAALLERAFEHLSDARLATLACGPRTLVHGDLHTQNFLLDHAATAGDASSRWRMVILDWQDTAVGHPVHDLCQVLGGDTLAEVQRVHGEHLLHHYHAALRAAGVSDWSLAQLRKDRVSGAARVALSAARFLAEYTPENATEQTTLTREWRRTLTALELALSARW